MPGEEISPPPIQSLLSSGLGMAAVRAFISGDVILQDNGVI